MTNENEDRTSEATSEAAAAKLKELEERLAAARRRKQTIEDKREALASSVDELTKKAEREEQAAKDAEALLVAEQMHGRKWVRAVETELGMVIVKKAPAPLFRRFQDTGQDATTEDVEKLVRPCVIHPSKDRFDEICNEQPATLVQCADQISELAGFRNKAVAAK